MIHYIKKKINPWQRSKMTLYQKIGEDPTQESLDLLFDIQLAFGICLAIHNPCNSYQGG